MSDEQRGRKSTVGIIAEFNPFHSGHAYLISEAKRVTGADCAIVVMSGDYVQRGEPAICDKYIRTRMALENGADIVIELPVTYATGAAGRFAEGAVRLLMSLGCTDTICFGSECGNISQLQRLADFFTDESEEYKLMLRNEMKKGVSFPAAREAVYKNMTGDAELAGVLEASNNILGLEYCMAVRRVASELTASSSDNGEELTVPKLMTVRRLGADYSDVKLASEGYSSATAIRSILAGEHCSFDSCSMNFDEALPTSVQEILRQEFGRSLPVAADDLSSVLFTRLNSMTLDELAAIMDMTPDLLDRIMKFRELPLRFTELVQKVKTKNMTYSSVSRVILHIALGITSVDRQGIPYARLLGFRREASELLRYISGRTTVRLITKLADADREDPLLKQDVAAAQLYEQIEYVKFGVRPIEEYKVGIVIR